MGIYCVFIFEIYIYSQRLKLINTPMENRDYQLLENISKNSKHLVSLQSEEIFALAEIFHISKQTDKALCFDKLRKILCSVLLIERENYEDYLQLPKFKRIKSQCKQKIIYFWEHTWLTYVHKRDEEIKNNQNGSNNPKNSHYIPYGMPPQTNLKDTRPNYYELYPNYQPYPKYPISTQKMGYTGFPYYYPYPYSQNYNPNPNLTKFDNSQKSQQIVRPVENNPSLMNPINSVNLGISPNKQDVANNLNNSTLTGINNPLKQGNQLANINNQNVGEPLNITSIEVQQNNNISQAQVKDSTFKNQAESSSYNGKVSNKSNKSNKSKTNNIINIQFLNCVCMGRDNSEKYFKCPLCQNFFHFHCVQISSVSQEKSCPLCILTKQSIFVEQFLRPIKSGWIPIKSREHAVVKLHLTEDELGMLKRCLELFESQLRDQKSYSINIRALRIIQKSSKQKHPKKSIKTISLITFNDLNKSLSRKWMQLNLKRVDNPSIVFYVVTIVRRKSKQKLINDYKHINDNYNITQKWLQKEKKMGKKVIVNLIHPFTKSLIQFPVRGQFCEHLECQDLLYLYNIYVSSSDGGNKLECSWCNKSYTSQSKFNCDKSIFNLLQKRESNCNRIRCTEEGVLQWVSGKDDQEKGIKDAEQNQESQSQNNSNT